MPSEASARSFEAPEDWRAPFLDFLKWGILPIDVVDARRLVRHDKSYQVLHL